MIAGIVLAAAVTVISGQAVVHDGDTIVIGTEHIRLAGIDAPELKQACERGGVTYLCGRTARDALIDHIGSRPVTCKPTGAVSYGRPIATCFVCDEDINSWMVANGYAFAYTQYSHAYVTQQEYAKTNKLGAWQDDNIIYPWDWRHFKK